MSEPEKSGKRKREEDDGECEGGRVRIPAEELPPYINYWLNEARPDCYFQVGPEAGPVERIGALRTILSAHSEPLRAMFESGYRESAAGEVRVVDVEPDTFKTLLKCMCGASQQVVPGLTMDAATKLLQAADKYLVEHVRTEVLTHVAHVVTHRNVFAALCSPPCLRDADLSQRVLNILQRHARDILSDKQFLTLTTDALFWILQQSNLNCKEIDIWNSVLKWCKSQSDSSEGKTLRKYAYPFLNHIRFLTMDLKEFWKYVVPSKILNLEEIVVLCKSLSSGIPHNMNYICNVKKHRQMHIASDNIVTVPLTYVAHTDVFCTIKNCRELKWQEDSELFSWLGLKWKISVGKRNDDGPPCLAVFLSCYSKGEPFTCPVRLTAILLSEDGTRQHYRTLSGVLTEQSPSTGLSDFCWWAKLTRHFVRHNEARLIVGILLI